VKEFIATFSRFDTIPDRDGQTERHSATAKTRYAEHRAAKTTKPVVIYYISIQQWQK